MAVLQKDIAKELNMSTATISRCLKRDPRISAATHTKVMSCAARLGYRPEKMEKYSDIVLAGNSLINNFNIAAMVQVQDSGDAVLIGNAVLTGMSIAAQRLGVSLMLHMVPVEKRDKIHLMENQPRALVENNLNGAILVYRFGEESVRKLAEQIPCVTVSHYHPEADIDYVGPDNMGGISAMVDYLVKKGHKRLGYISHLYKSSFFDERWSGFITGLARNGLEYSPEYVLRYKENTISNHGHTLKKWIESGVTAFVCANDSVAYCICRWLIDHKYRVPEDVAVTGFDNDYVPTDIPDLTTVDVNFTEIGRLALELMVARLKDPTRAYVRVITDCKIKEGNTA